MIDERVAARNYGYKPSKTEIESSVSSMAIERDWAKFCLFPDVVEPIRMPSLFPVATHIVKRRISKVISGSDEINIKWAPEFLRGIGLLGVAGKSAVTTDNIQPGDTATSTSFVTTYSRVSSWTVSDSSDMFDLTPSLGDELGHGGVRLIGACLKLTYLGKVDDLSGLIETGMHLNAHNKNLWTTGDLYSAPNTRMVNQIRENLHYATLDEIQQQSYYQRTSTNDGIRLVWIPVDPTKFELGNTVSYAPDQPSAGYVYFNQGDDNASEFGTTTDELTTYRRLGEYFLSPAISLDFGELGYYESISAETGVYQGIQYIENPLIKYTIDDLDGWQQLYESEVSLGLWGSILIPDSNTYFQTFQDSFVSGFIVFYHEPFGEFDLFQGYDTAKYKLVTQFNEPGFLNDYINNPYIRQYVAIPLFTTLQPSDVLYDPTRFSTLGKNLTDTNFNRY